ncbi:hypothetical protein J6590_003492 [Homalodisca vitripennis]|nr:hypothetical protein J6590_003492 [Homalodisca vitripennis]
MSTGDGLCPSHYFVCQGNGLLVLGLVCVIVCRTLGNFCVKRRSTLRIRFVNRENDLAHLPGLSLSWLISPACRCPDMVGLSVTCILGIGLSDPYPISVSKVPCMVIGIPTASYKLRPNGPSSYDTWRRGSLYPPSRGLAVPCRGRVARHLKPGSAQTVDNLDRGFDPKMCTQGTIVPSCIMWPQGSIFTKRSSQWIVNPEPDTCSSTKTLSGVESPDGSYLYMNRPTQEVAPSSWTPELA